MNARPTPGDDGRPRRGPALLLAAIATALLFAANVLMEILSGDPPMRAVRDQLEARELMLFALFFAIAFRVARRQTCGLRRAPANGDRGEREGDAISASR